MFNHNNEKQSCHDIVHPPATNHTHYLSGTITVVICAMRTAQCSSGQHIVNPQLRGNDSKMDSNASASCP
eukprot:2238471-Amphidinium_carterae.1